MNFLAKTYSGQCQVFGSGDIDFKWILSYSKTTTLVNELRLVQAEQISIPFRKKAPQEIRLKKAQPFNIKVD